MDSVHSLLSSDLVITPSSDPSDCEHVLIQSGHINGIYVEGEKTQKGASENDDFEQVACENAVANAAQEVSTKLESFTSADLEEQIPTPRSPETKNVNGVSVTGRTESANTALTNLVGLCNFSPLDLIRPLDLGPYNFDP